MTQIKTPSVQRQLEMRWAHQITTRSIDWLWKPWLARGVVSVLDGDPGVGKSMLTMDLVARLTTGRAMPLDGDSHPPQNCLVVALEDPLDSVVRPRLEAAGADLSSVAFLEGVKETGPGGSLEAVMQLPRDLDLITAETVRHQPALMVIDPLFAVLGLDKRGRCIKASDDQGVRQLTGQFKVLAERVGTHIMLVRHLNKASGGAAIKRGSGSIAITGQARSVLLAAKDPNNHECGILAMTKTNLAAMPKSIRYRITSDGLSSRLDCLGPCDATADELLSPGTTADYFKRAVTTAEDFLEVALQDGGRTWEDLVAMAAKEGIAEITLRRAREEKDLEKEFVAKHKCVWKLPPRLNFDFMRR